AAQPPTPTTEIFADTPVAADVRAVAADEGHCPPSLTLGLPPSQSSIAFQNILDAYTADEVPPFSVLMSTYDGDNPDFLRSSLKSVGTAQQLKPDQIVLVQDGPVRPELAAVIEQAAVIAGQPVDVVPLEHNSGLAVALDRGLEHCTHEIVARADADDISLPTRFAVQIPLMKHLDLLGSALTEFDQDPQHLGLTRALPTSAYAIRSIARLRDPFNHPTVVLRKTAVLAAGGYSGGATMEDYWLFARMIHRGARVANVREPLVLYRVGAGAYKRRGGIAMARTELQLQRSLRSIGFTTMWQFLRNMAVRLPYRLLPAKARRVLYQSVGKLLWFRR
ncbi:MAG: glycosyltransferase, partial [Arcanobacterium sp.]|nr:glycosyltransferase [Arcanobacterium sp.]